MLTKRRNAALLLALALLVTACLAGFATAHAAEKACRVRVQSGTEEAAGPLSEAGAVADLYLIANSPREGVYDYPGLDPDTGQDGWRELAEKEALDKIGKTAPDISCLYLGAWADVNDAGEDITPGLYLLVVRPSEGTDYMKTFQDENNKDYLASEIISKEYSIRIAPEVIAVPGKNMDVGPANSADGTPWVYDADVSVKPEIEKRLGSIEIVKDLLSYEESHDAFFLFQCEGYLDGEHVYSNLVSMRFSDYGEQRVRLDNIPVGTEVTVTEVYSTPGYGQVSTSPSDGKITVSSDEVLSVRFENDYDGTRDKGGGIMNNFDYDLERGEWSWTQD